jgi:hypothetical protein
MSDRMYGVDPLCGGLGMNILQIHRAPVQFQTATEQKKIHYYQPGDQKLEDEKWNFDLNFCVVCDFVSYFCKRGRYMSSESSFQSDFESVILHLASSHIEWDSYCKCNNFNLFINTV